MDMRDEQTVIVYLNGHEVYSGLWGDMNEDMQRECECGDMFLLAPVELADVLFIISE